MPYSTGTYCARQGKMRLSLSFRRPGHYSVTSLAVTSRPKAENIETNWIAGASIRRSPTYWQIEPSGTTGLGKSSDRRSYFSAVRNFNNS